MKKSKTPAVVNALEKFGVTQVTIADVASKKTDAEKSLAFIRNAPCKTLAQEKWADEQLANVVALHDQIDRARTAITKPMNEAKRAVDALFAPVLKPLKEAEDVLREKLKGPARARFLAEQEALRIAQEAASKGDTTTATEAIESIPDVVENTSSSTSLTWNYRVVDIYNVDPVFILVNDALVKAYVREHLKKGSTEPPAIRGLEFVPDVTLRRKG